MICTEHSVSPAVLEPADIVLMTGNEPPHAALVVTVDRSRVLLAKGKHDKVSLTGHLRSEVALVHPDDLAVSGLREPTRFDLAEAFWTPASALRRLGRFPTANKGRMRELKSAIEQARGGQTHARRRAFYGDRG